MRRLAISLIAALILALPVAGCGDDGQSATETKTINGDGYTFEAPEGWEDVTGDTEAIADVIGGGSDVAAAAAAAYDVAVASEERTDGLHTNFNVGRQGDLPPDYDSQQLAEQNIAVFENPDQVEGILPEGIDVDFIDDEPTRTTLGGETAYQVEYGLSTAAADVEALQIYAVHDEVAYVATFTAASEAFDPDDEDLQHILETWEWD